MTERDTINRLVRAEIQAMQAYHVPPAQDLIKLDAMENPWSWSPRLRDEWRASLRDVDINRYPDPAASRLATAMREVLGVPANAAVILGNGSDELIQMIIQTVAAPGRVVLAPEPTFVMYRQIAIVANMKYVGVPLKSDFSIDESVMLTALDEYQPAVTFLAYPNNPTGNLFSADSLHKMLDRADGLIVIDEAYAPFTDASFMEVLDQYDNLLVLRTVSKMGLAGLRLGMLAGAPAWLEQIDKTRLPYNISVVNQVTGEFALGHADMLAAQALEIRAQRSIMSIALQDIDALTVYPSEANFILFRTPAGQATLLFEGLKAAGILIKNLDVAGGALQDCLRVTIGTPDENASFLQALQRLLSVL